MSVCRGARWGLGLAQGPQSRAKSVEEGVLGGDVRGFAESWDLSKERRLWVGGQQLSIEVEALVLAGLGDQAAVENQTGHGNVRGGERVEGEPGVIDGPRIGSHDEEHRRAKV